MEINTKQCSRCQIEKSVNEFSKCSATKDGFSYLCKKCIKEYTQRPEVKECNKKYHKKYYHRLTVIDHRKKWRKKHCQKPEVKERDKEYSQKSAVIERHRKYQKEYRQRPDAKEHKREYQKEYNKNCRQNNPQYKLNDNMRGGIYKSLRSNKNGKHWETLVNYTLRDLRIHLEKLFDKNMNWNNYGSYWNLDHIIPQSWYIYTKPEDIGFKMCWGLDNLQPLKKEKNFKKSDLRGFINSLSHL